MFVPFLIMLREGLEAALIVSLIASYLKRTQRGRWIGVMWIGVLLAAALCLLQLYFDVARHFAHPENHPGKDHHG
ncbi:FTR1 family protein, partial [Escherichia coli]